MKRHDIQADAFDMPARGAALLSVTLAEGEALQLAIRSEGTGPRVLVVGGTHGDEFEGQIAALELARALPDIALRGRLIVLALHNPGACRAGQRRTPVDGRDLNRAYGAPDDGTPTARIAGFVATRLLPEVDLVIDLHSGGRETAFVLSSNLQARPESAEHAEMRPLLLAFGAPYAITFDEVGAGPGAMPHAGTLEALARGRGLRALSSEIGGSGGVTAASLAVARQGLVNVLQHLGLARFSHAERWQDSRSVELALTRPEEHLAAPVAGWFVPRVALGDQVRRGCAVGAVLRDDDPFAPPVPVVAQSDGVVVALFHPVRCGAGTTLAFIAARLPTNSAGFR